MGSFFAYILISEKDKKHYYGHASDLKIRLKNHNSGKVKSTKSRRPMRILYSEEFTCKSDAIKRKLFFKSVNGYKWLKENGII